LTDLRKVRKQVIEMKTYLKEKKEKMTAKPTSYTLTIIHMKI